VILGEDDFIAREGISRLLESLDGFELAAACGDLESLEDAVERERPDAVLTDIRMPPTHTDEGVRVAAALRRSHPGLGVVVLSQYDDPDHALRVFDGGVARRGYLLKDSVAAPEQLVTAVRTVAAGGSTIDPLVVEAMLGARAAGVDSPLARLSPREREVLAEMASGRNNSAIAARLVLTVRAVERHINSIFAKLGLAEEEDYHRRVRAVLLFLAER
jgi:DNA-binding NarL/FixJ family response regulator